jgi:hypothetical protein
MAQTFAMRHFIASFLGWANFFLTLFITADWKIKIFENFS